MFNKNNNYHSLDTATENQAKKAKKKFFQKRIPTIIGLIVLVVALVAGTLLFSQGTGVFAPRATPQTTPKKIKITNVNDSGFTVSFLTDEATVGFIKYGTAQNKINIQTGDDRDQLSGAVAKYKLHHITVRGLEPNMAYFFNLGTGSGSFDNNSQPFSVKTAQRTGIPSAAKTVYGSVVTATGKPADGAIVYLATEGVAEMSSLVKSSGSWAIPLSNARLADGAGYAQIKDQDTLTLVVQGDDANLTSTVSTLVADAQPVANITLGESANLADGRTAPGDRPTPSLTPNIKPPAMEPPEMKPPAIEPPVSDSDSTTAAEKKSPNDPTKTGGLGDLVSDGDASTTADLTGQNVASSSAAMITELDLDQAALKTITLDTTKPTIKGKALPNVTVSIEINSQTQITQDVVADSAGNFSIDLEQLKKELEPGEHTVTYSYIDPNTGETITKTETFTVAPDSVNNTANSSTNNTSEAEQLAMADTNTYPYSSSNPYNGNSATGGADESSLPTDESSTLTGRTSMPASSSSGLPVSGSVGTTYALIIGGLFFILAGVWSWWVAKNLNHEWV